MLGLALACGHPTRDYRGPDPGRPDVARLVATFSEPLSSEIENAPSVHLLLYAVGDACLDEQTLQAAYLGSRSLHAFEQQLVVPSGRFLLLRVRMHAGVRDVEVYCDVDAGFTPEAGALYALDFSAFTARVCRLHLRDEQGRDVPVSRPPRCEAR